MTTLPAPSRGIVALVTGAATTLHFAAPDLLPSRTIRGWVKAGLTAISLAAAVPELRAAWATRPAEQGTEGEQPLGRAFASLSASRKALVLAPVAAFAAGAVAGVVAAERWAFRHGEARAAAGKRLPHTGPALLYGALSAGLSLLPAPSAPSAP